MTEEEYNRLTAVLEGVCSVGIGWLSALRVWAEACVLLGAWQGWQSEFVNSKFKFKFKFKFANLAAEFTQSKFILEFGAIDAVLRVFVVVN